MVRWTPAWAVLGAALVACGYRAELSPNGESGAGGQAAGEGAGEGSSNDQPIPETPDSEAPDAETPETPDTEPPDDAGEASAAGAGGSGASDAPGTGGTGGSEADSTVDIGPAQCGDGAAWAFELVDDGLHDHVDAALAVRADGAVFVAYTDVFGVHLAHDAGGTWVVDSLDEAEGYYAGASLVLDADGSPRVAYSRKQDAVIYATRSSDGGFTLETVEAAAGGSSTGIALDASGAPHVTYYSQGRDAAFRYAVRTNTGWSVTTLDDDAFDRDSAIAIDGAGVVHISYYSRALRYVNNAGGSGFTLLESHGGMDSAIVLADSPIIAHCETGVGVLVGSPETGFEELGYGVETSLARSANGTLHLAYTVSESGLDYATNASGSFESEPITNGASPWSNSALAVAPDGTPYVAVSTLNGELYLGRRCAAD